MTTKGKGPTPPLKKQGDKKLRAAYLRALSDAGVSVDDLELLRELAETNRTELEASVRVPAARIVIS